MYFQLFRVARRAILALSALTARLNEIKTTANDEVARARFRGVTVFHPPSVQYLLSLPATRGSYGESRTR